MRLLEAILDANHRAVAGDDRAGLHPAEFAESLPIIALTCIDPRLNRLMPEVLGIPEEHFIWLRNAGNVITGPLSSTMRSMALACALKGGREIVVIGHTDCLVGKISMMDLTERLKSLGVERARLPENLTEYFGLFASERQNVSKAVEFVRASPLIGPHVPVHGLLVNIQSGRLEWVVNGYQVLETASSAPVTASAALDSGAAPLDALKQLLPFQLGEMKFPEGKIGELVTQAGGILGRIEQAASRAEHLPGKAGEFAEKVGHLAEQAAGWLQEVQVQSHESKSRPPPESSSAQTAASPTDSGAAPHPAPPAPSAGGKDILVSNGRMHTVTFLQDLAVVMMVAGLVTVFFHRFKQPVVLGYIIAGVIIGPHTPPFPLIHDEGTINTLSELGVILLMFSLGLEFNLRKLRQVGGPAFLAAFLEILLMAWVGYEIGRLFGWSTMDSIFLGAILSVSSTTIIVKALGELGKTRERFAQLIFGILIIEDLLAIAMIALLSGMAMTGGVTVTEVGMTLGRLGIFLVASLVFGLLAVPRLLGYVARFKSNEMLLITVLGLCFGFSLLAVKLGYSVALGAFLIGAVIAESREIHRIETLIEPVRDMFSAVFFVAIGLMIDPGMLVAYWLPIVVITVAVVAGKIVTCSFGSFVGGNDGRTSLRVGMGLAQIGEFSFIIASLGLSLNVTSKFLYPIAVAVSAITTLLTPYLIQGSDGVASRLSRWAPRSVANVLGLYTSWVGQIGQRPSSQTNQWIRRWTGQMALNAALIAAVFIAAGYAGRKPPGWLQGFGSDGEWLKAALWLAAVILSLPMFIATSRKLQALGLLIAETRVTPAAAGERTAAIRAIVANFIPIAGTLILGLYVLVLSATLLPTFEVFVVLLLIAVLISWLLRRSFIRVYAKAQVALTETLSQPPAPRHETPAVPLPLLREANLATVELPTGASAVGLRLHELQLRSRTGASVVGIERAGGSVINPGPEDELLAGDQVLLLGSRGQLEAARAALLNPAQG